MSKYSRSEIEQLIKESSFTLRNAVQNAKLRSMLADHGYDPGKLARGIALVEDLTECHAAYCQRAAEYREATSAYHATFKHARRLFERHARISKALFSNRPECSERLGLNAIPTDSFEPWLRHARQYYREAVTNAQLQNNLVEVGLSPAILGLGQAAVEDTAMADRLRDSAQSLAQQAEQQRDIAAKSLKAWMRKFWKTAKKALAKKPKQLEQLRAG
ncbi:MAG: hypothetical protein JXB35_17840 [Anaerolineae bacterium]|nr:hypothetical protein [Anaerolineae bacterium]